jgi:hypothetical protein
MLKTFRQCQRILILLVFPLLIAACTTSFMYRNLDWLIPWYVDGMVDISRVQRAELRERLEPLLQWHREEELQRYLDLLDQLESDLQARLTPDQVISWVEAVTDAVMRVESRLLDVAIEFGGEMSDQQIREFADELWEKQDELEQEYLPRTDQEYIEESFKYFSDFTRKQLGRLTQEQEDRFRRAANSLIRFDSAWLQDRRAWLERISSLMERPPGWQKTLRDAYDNRRSMQSDEYRRIWEHNLEIISEAMVDVLNGRIPRQSEQLAKEIERWQSRLEKLIEEKE